MRKFVIFFIILSAVFLFRYQIVGQAVYGDGIFYWAFTRSLYFDHNIHYENELSHQYSHKGNNSITIEKNHQTKENYTINGYLQNRYPIGSPLLWLFFMTIADLMIKVMQLVHMPIIRNGYSDMYQITVGLGNITLVILGLFFLEKFLLLLSKNKKLITLSIVTILFATNLFYYSSIDVINSHPLSFFLSSIFMYLWWKTHKHRSFRMWFFLGILIGLLALNRTLDAVFASFLLIDTYYSIQNRERVIDVVKKIILASCGFLLAFFPQILTWSIMYDTIWKSPYLSYRGAFDVFHPHILEIIFDKNRGLFFFSPLILVTLSELFHLKSGNKRLFWSVFFVFFLQFYTIASWDGWHQGESYGIRMFISLIPIFTVLLLKLLARLSQKIRFQKLVIFCSIFIFTNFITIFIFQIFLHHPTYVNGELSQSSVLKEQIKHTLLLLLK